MGAVFLCSCLEEKFQGLLFLMDFELLSDSYGKERSLYSSTPLNGVLNTSFLRTTLLIRSILIVWAHLLGKGLLVSLSFGLFCLAFSCLDDITFSLPVKNKK